MLFKLVFQEGKYKKMCNKFRTFAHVRVLVYVCDVRAGVEKCLRCACGCGFWVAFYGAFKGGSTPHPLHRTKVWEEPEFETCN